MSSEAHVRFKLEDDVDIPTRVTAFGGKLAFQRVLDNFEDAKKIGHLNKTRPMKWNRLLRYQFHNLNRWLLKQTRLVGTGLKLTSLPSHEVVVRQSSILCKEYILNRLKKQGISPPPYLEESCKAAAIRRKDEVCRELQFLGGELERMYPSLYRNISRQLNITMSSIKVIRRTFKLVAEQLTRNYVTWGKVVALFCMAKAFAVDCLMQDKPEYVEVVTECFSEAVDIYLAEWIVQQGGWIDITRAFRTSKESPRVWAVSTFGAMMGFVIVIVAALEF